MHGTTATYSHAGERSHRTHDGIPDSMVRLPTNCNVLGGELRALSSLRDE